MRMFRVKNPVAILLTGTMLMLGQQPPPVVVPRAAPPAAPPATAPVAPAPRIDVPAAYNIRDGSLLEVIDLLARSLKINYILDSKVKGGTVTINTYGEIKAEDIRPVLETILRMNNLAMVQAGNFYRIVLAADAPRLPLAPQVDMKDFPDDERMLLNLIFLKYMTAPEMETILKPFISESAAMSTYAPANLLLIEDNSRNMKRSVELIKLFDSDQFAGQRVQLFTTQNSRPSDLVKELDTVFKAYALSEKVSAVRFIAIDRINTIIGVAANPGIFKEVTNWIGKLDLPASVAAGGVENYVYRLKYGRAENVGGVITQLYGGARPVSTGTSPYDLAGTRATGTGFLNSNPASQMGNPSSTVTGPGLNALAGTVGNTAAPSATSPNGAAATPAVTPFGTVGNAGGSNDLTGQYLSADNGTARINGLPRIIPNPLDNTLLVQSTPQQWRQILKLLEQLDVPPRQVLIDARIYEVDLNGAFASGVEAYLQQAGSTATSTTRQLMGTLINATTGATSLTAGMLVGHSRQLLGAVTFSESHGTAHVISAPSVIATDSIPAAITVGTTVPTLSAQAVGGIQSGGNSQFTQSISNQSTGVSLNIIARVNASGIVTLVIDQSVSAPLPLSSNTSSSINSPSFSQREVSTQVTVQDGDTIAIGGIIQETQSLNTTGIPGLDRIPYIGGLFGTKSYAKARTELIVFLTPRVIYDTNQIAEATEELRQKLKGIAKLDKNQ